MISRVTNGRTASCTRTISSSCAAAATAFSAFPTDCWRCSPPTTSSIFFFRTSLFGTSRASIPSRARNPAISPSRRAIQISFTTLTAANLRSVWMRIGVPPSSVNCLEGDALRLPLAPTGTGTMRVPRPAAGMITTTFIAGSKYTGGGQGVQIQKQFTAEHPVTALGEDGQSPSYLRGAQSEGLPYNAGLEGLLHPHGGGGLVSTRVFGITAAGPGAPGVGGPFGGTTPLVRAKARSSHLPKIIFPAVVCSTDVTETSMVLPIIFRALSTTTMVPSSR